jgi:hypothetical protein
MTHYKNFVLRFVKITLGFLFLSCMAIIFLDPWDLKSIAGLTIPKKGNYDFKEISRGFKPVPDGEHRGKLLNTIWKTPDAVIMGSSVAAGGFDIANSFWSSDKSLTYYNYGIAGLSIREMEMHFYHLHALKPLKKILICLDFFAFNALKPNNIETQIDKPPFANQPTYRKNLSKILIKTAFSYQYLKATLESVKIFANTIGFFNSLIGKFNILMTKILVFSNRDIKEALERRALIEFEHIVRHALFPGGKSNYSFDDKKGWSSYETLRKMIVTAQKNNAQIVLLIPPCHVRLLEIIEELGLQKEFIEWKRKLLEMVIQIAEANPSLPQISLWDFAYRNAVTTSPIIRAENKSSTKGHFYDPIHFDAELGDRIFQIIYGSNQNPRDEAIGVLLSKHNIEQHLNAASSEKRK